MEVSFLVWIENSIYQVDAGAFMMNQVLFIVYEILNYEPGKTLSKDDVCGKIGNYNLISVNQYQFFDEAQSISTNMKIPEFIQKRIYDFLLELTDNYFRVKECSFVFDTLIFSNSIDNISDYVCKLMGIKNSVSLIKDISTVEAYEYYP